MVNNGILNCLQFEEWRWKKQAKRNIRDI